MPVILALDFETANQSPDSACQLGMVRLQDWQVTHSQSWLIRPPSDYFEFSWLHNITWDQVRDKPSWAELWPQLAPLVQQADFLAAHNAPFDRRVLEASCRFHGLEAPRKPYIDTVALARKQWKIFPTKLNLVCAQRGIPLDHHEALSDANACAQIIIQASAEGWRP